MSTSQATKKQQIQQYKQREITGCIYQIKNNMSNRFFLSFATNSESPKNAFEFSTKTNSCIKPQLKQDWDHFGAESFRYEILEELEKKPDQSDKEFRDDLKALEELWLEKLDKSLCVNHKA